MRLLGSSWLTSCAMFGGILLLCASAAAAAAADAAQAATAPDWVVMYPQRPLSQEDWDINKLEVRKRNARSQRYDLVLYGDSLTADMFTTRKEVWDTFFPAPLVTAPLGMGGSTIQELAYRILFGGEQPTKPPRAVVLLIGYNNARYRPETDHVPMVRWLLRWMQKNWPQTRLALSALIPNEFIDVAPINRRYRALAKRQGVLYFSCSKGLDPRNKRQYSDGTHLLPAGQRIYLRCMQRRVAGLLK